MTINRPMPEHERMHAATWRWLEPTPLYLNRTENHHGGRQIQARHRRHRVIEILDEIGFSAHGYPSKIAKKLGNHSRPMAKSRQFPEEEPLIGANER